MVNQSVNEFNTQFLFKIDALPQYVLFPLDISITAFNNFSLNVRELLISDRVHLPSRPPTKTNNQGNHTLLLVRNAVVEAGNKIIMKKASCSHKEEAAISGNPWELLWGNPSIYID